MCHNIYIIQTSIRNKINWQEIRTYYPQQWLLTEAVKARSEGGKRILEQIAVINTFPDSISAMNGYKKLKHETPGVNCLYFIPVARNLILPNADGWVYGVFKNPENNDFIIANQFTVTENNVSKRPDLILFVNGLVVIELKNPADENATIKSAFKQLQAYKQAIPHLFTYNGFMVISDGLEARTKKLKKVTLNSEQFIATQNDIIYEMKISLFLFVSFCHNY